VIDPTDSDDALEDRTEAFGRPARRHVLASLASLGLLVPGCLQPSSRGGSPTDTEPESSVPTESTRTTTSETPTDVGTSTGDGTPTTTDRDTTEPPDTDAATDTGPESVSILLFAATGGYRHNNIEYGLERLRGLQPRIAAETGTDADAVSFETIATDASRFPSDVDSLSQYDTVVWFNTTGDVLDADQQAAFERYITNGGGYTGVHAAADTEYDWDFYGSLLGGAYFSSHPAPQEATIRVSDRSHPSTAHLPERWTVTDEWYDFRANPRENVRVLATLDEDTYDGHEMPGSDHPIVWCRELRGGRAWYTGRGHTKRAFDDTAFKEHLLGGMLWSSGLL
jgi:type 1 glutamine amidotransferase